MTPNIKYKIFGHYFTKLIFIL